MATAALGQSKFWCFTINNPAPFYADLNGAKNWVYLVVGNEIAPSTGTPHLQGFIAYKVRTKFSTVKIQFPRAKLAMMYKDSNPVAASTYCKKDGDYEEFGTLPDFQGGATGGSAKAQNFRRIIDLSENADYQTLKEDHPSEYFRHYHTIKRIAMDNPKPVTELDKLDNDWIWGKTGLGKSRIARKENPGIFVHLKNKWWIGYKDEETILFDDIGRSESVWIGDKLKTYCDHYPFPCETKGDGSLIRPKRIIVTSNYSIDDLFCSDPELVEALNRRFNVRHVIQPFPFPIKKVAPIQAPVAPVVYVVEDSEESQSEEFVNGYQDPGSDLDYSDESL